MQRQTGRRASSMRFRCAEAQGTIADFEACVRARLASRCVRGEHAMSERRRRHVAVTVVVIIVVAALILFRS